MPTINELADEELLAELARRRARRQTSSSKLRDIVDEVMRDVDRWADEQDK